MKEEPKVPTDAVAKEEAGSQGDFGGIHAAVRADTHVVDLGVPQKYGALLAWIERTSWKQTTCGP